MGITTIDFTRVFERWGTEIILGFLILILFILDGKSAIDFVELVIAYILNSIIIIDHLSYLRTKYSYIPMESPDLLDVGKPRGSFKPDALETVLIVTIKSIQENPDNLMSALKKGIIVEKNRSRTVEKIKIKIDD